MKRKGFIIATSVIVAIMVAAACVAKFYVFATWSGDDVRVNIPAGADVRSVLTSQLGPSFGGKVYNMWKWQDGTTEGSRGSYVIHDGDEAVRVARRIAQGRCAWHRNSNSTRQRLWPRVTLYCQLRALPKSNMSRPLCPTHTSFIGQPPRPRS